MVNNVIPLSTEEFRLIRDLVAEYCGIYFDERLRFIVQLRLNNRLNIHRMKDFREYYRLLRYDKDRDREIQEIIDILTVNETYFFRGGTQIEAFRKEILPEIKETNRSQKRISIWSAGCSTGEEPYTIAMCILEDHGFAGWDINIVGSDISQRVLKTARMGIYRQNSFRCTDEYFINEYFVKNEHGEYEIKEICKRLVNFSFLNLIDSYKVKLIGQMDVIFCRNVLMYFSNEARKVVADNLYDVLRKGGYLFLGHSESLMNITTKFRLKNLQTDIVYQKP
ncbi:MAG: protein-glutamate O-methyltransferase CheR [Thermodesulfovibrionia bacterium]